MADWASDGLAEATAEFAIQANALVARFVGVRFLWSLTLVGVGDSSRRRGTL